VGTDYSFGLAKVLGKIHRQKSHTQSRKICRGETFVLEKRNEVGRAVVHIWNLASGVGFGSIFAANKSSDTRALGASDGSVVMLQESDFFFWFQRRNNKLTANCTRSA
jgi:hypothetical protein